jgi:membrane protease YdiL (CAAX protease family)
VLTSSWIAAGAGGRVAAWVSLGAADDDERVFWHTVAAALLPVADDAARAAFLIMTLVVAWPALVIPDLTGLPEIPFLLVANFVGLFGSALLVTRWTGGPGAIRRLLAGTLRWRFGAGRYLVILLGMPAVTIAVAASMGTLNIPDGWAGAALRYALFTVVLGTLIFNLWEETAWTGFLQSRLMDRHGLLIGAVLTAPWFVAIHLPLSFAPGWTWSNAALNLGLLVLAAPFIRYLLGAHYLATGGSLLAVGLQHAAFNASAGLGLAGWEYIAAVLILTLLVAGHRTLTRSRPTRSVPDPIMPQSAPRPSGHDIARGLPGQDS